MTRRVVVLFAKLDVLGAKLHVLYDDFFVAFELGIWRQALLIHLHHLDPIDPDLGLLVFFVMGFGLPAFLFRRQLAGRFVRLDLRLALFPLEPIVLVAQTLDFFGLLFHLGRQLFHQVHQIQDHLPHTFVCNGVGIEVF